MSFLEQQNFNILLDIIREEIPNVNINTFQHLFNDFGKKEHGDLLTLNKKFINIFFTIVNDPTHSLFPLMKTELKYTQMNITSQDFSKSRKVSFDHALEKHRQHFQTLANPPIPAVPNFQDKLDDEQDNLDHLLQQTLLTRQYDIPFANPNPNPNPNPNIPTLPLQQHLMPLPQQHQQPNRPRLLEIGSLIPETEINHQIIDILPNLNSATKLQTITQQPTQPEKISSSFLSKLQQKAQTINKSHEEELSGSFITQTSAITQTTNIPIQHINTSTINSINDIIPLETIKYLQQDNREIKNDINEIKQKLIDLQKYFETTLQKKDTELTQEQDM